MDGSSLLDFLQGTTTVSCPLADMLFVVELTRNAKSSNARVRVGTQTALNTVLIGAVPDRGGRPDESRPAPEMPRFRSRTVGEAKQQRDKGGKDRGSHRLQHGPGAQGGGGKHGGRGGRGGGGKRGGRGRGGADEAS